MKVKKVSQKPLNSPRGKKSAIAKRKKRDLSKLSTEEFLEQNFETDSDAYDDDDEGKTFDFLLYFKLFYPLLLYLFT